MKFSPIDVADGQIFFAGLHISLMYLWAKLVHPARCIFLGLEPDV